MDIHLVSKLKEDLFPSATKKELKSREANKSVTYAEVQWQMDADGNPSDLVDSKGHSVRGADWKDHEGFFDAIGAELNQFGLRLIVGGAGDDNIWVCITKKGI